MNNHQHFMQRCYELAELAGREGESPVGSVIVKDGINVLTASCFNSWGRPPVITQVSEGGL